MNDSRRRTTAMLPWLAPLALLVLVVVIASASSAPGWVTGLIEVVVLGILGYGGTVWYYRRYRQFHNPDDNQ